MEKIRLSAEDAFKCLVKYRTTGDIVARDLLYFDSIPRIYKAANEFKGLGISVESLVSEANMRFLEVVENYDISNTNPNSFLAYLDVSIKNAVTVFVQNVGNRNWLEGAKKLISLEDVDTNSYPLESVEEQYFGQKRR